MRFSIPYAGWVFIALSRPGLRLWLVILPALALAGWALVGVWREGGSLLREQSTREV